MELLELKSVWDAVVDDTLSKDTMDASGVAECIRKDSKSVLAQLKKAMYVKFSLGGLFLFVFLVLLTGSYLEPEQYTFYEAIFDVTDNRIFLGAGILFLTVMLSWNIRAFRAIRHFERSATSIKESLKRFIPVMNGTIQLNVYSSAIFDSIALGWICYLVNRKTGFVEGSFQIAGLVLLAVILGAIVFYSLARLKQKVKFGNYLNQLKSNLEDLDEK